MKLFRVLSMVTLVFALTFGATSCKKVSDADLQTAAQTALAANPELANVVASVEKQVVTLNGTVTAEELKATAQSAVAGIKNVKSVVNNLVVELPAPDFTAVDAALTTALADALKDHSTVVAEVKDGVVKLTGEIRKRDLQTLMEKVNALNPVQVINEINVK